MTPLMDLHLSTNSSVFFFVKIPHSVVYNSGVKPEKLRCSGMVIRVLASL